MRPSRPLFFHALKATLPVIVGYVPLGFAFGLLFAELGHHWAWAMAMSLAVYAGAAQFLAVGLLAAGAGLVDIGIATLILNARHAFFGVSLLERWRTHPIKKAFLIFWLTDETYAVITSLKAPEGTRETDFHLWVAGLNYAAWNTGTVAGAITGQALAFDTTGMDFALTALFAVLLVEQIREVRQPFPFLLALAAGLATLALFGAEHMLLISIGLSLYLLLLTGRRRGWQ